MVGKRVLIISEVFFPEIGSGANRMNNILILLKERGYKVDILTSNPSYPNADLYKDKSFWDREKMNKIYKDTNVFRVKECKVKRTGNFFSRLYIYLYFMFQSLFQIFKIKEKYDFVIATVPSIFVGLIGIVAKFRFKAKYILDIRDLWPECLKNVGVFRNHKLLLKVSYILEKILLHFTNSLVINSNGFRPYLESKGYKNQIVFIPNGVTEEELSKIQETKKNTSKNEKFTVIYTGMLGLPQNVKSIVRAANYLRRCKNINFKIIGTGIQKEKVKELIEHYKIGNVELHDAMPKDDVIKEICRADIAIVHLRGDSAFDLVIPGKMIDYMSIGIPIIAGIEGYTSTVLNDSKAGIVIKPDDYLSMAQNIQRLHKNKWIRERYSKNGLIYCKENFLWQTNIEKLIEVMNNLTERVHVGVTEEITTAEGFNE